MYLNTKPDPEGVTAFFDAFCSDEEQEIQNFAVLVHAERLPTSVAFLGWIAGAKLGGVEYRLEVDDSGDSIALLVERHEWSRRRIQSKWDALCAENLGTMIQACPDIDGHQVYEELAEEWCNQSIADRLGVLAGFKHQDLSRAILDEACDVVIDAAIRHQVNHLCNIAEVVG